MLVGLEVVGHHLDPEVLGPGVEVDDAAFFAVEEFIHAVAIAAGGGEDDALEPL